MNIGLKIVEMMRFVKIWEDSALFLWNMFWFQCLVHLQQVLIAPLLAFLVIYLRKRLKKKNYKEKKLIF